MNTEKTVSQNEVQALSQDEALRKIRGKIAEVYVARRGTATIVRCGGTDYLCNNLNPGGAWVVNPAESFWRGSIDWKGTKIDFMANGVVPPPSPGEWSIKETFDKDFDMMGLYGTEK